MINHGPKKPIGLNDPRWGILLSMYMLFVCYRDVWVFIPFILQWLAKDPYIVNHMAQFVQTWLKQSSPWTHLTSVSVVLCSCTLYEKVSSRVSNQHICENKVRLSPRFTYIPLVLPPHVVVVRLFGRQPLQNGEILVGDSQQFSLTFCFVETKIRGKKYQNLQTRFH